MDLSVRLGSLVLKNPVIAASGCFGYGVEYADVVDLASLGGVAVKGLFLAEREGHPAPRIVETPAGMLNAIGLQGIGVHRFVEEKLPELRARRATVIVNICGTTLDEYVEVARILSDADGVAALEATVLRLDERLSRVEKHLDELVAAEPRYALRTDVQELNGRVDALRDRLDALEKRFDRP